jgi:hypothetical protein
MGTVTRTAVVTILSRWSFSSSASLIIARSRKAEQQMSASGVRRDKAALSSGCKSHPATAPAGSNRSSHGGNEMAEAFGERITHWGPRECAGRNVSER